MTELAFYDDLQKKFRLSRRSIDRLRKTEGFPSPIKISSRRLAWPVEAIEQWLEGRQADPVTRINAGE